MTGDEPTIRWARLITGVGLSVAATLGTAAMLALVGFFYDLATRPLHGAGPRDHSLDHAAGLALLTILGAGLVVTWWAAATPRRLRWAGVALGPGAWLALVAASTTHVPAGSLAVCRGHSDEVLPPGWYLRLPGGTCELEVWPEADVRAGRAAHSLGAFSWATAGHEGEADLTVLEQFTRVPDPYERVRALDELVERHGGSPDAALVRVLRERLTDEELRVRTTAACHLALLLGPRALDAVPALRAGLRAAHPYNLSAGPPLYEVWRALAAVGPGALSALPDMLERAHELAERGLTRRAVLAFGPAAVPGLEAVLASPAPHVRLSAAAHLAALAPARAQAAVPVLEGALSGPDADAARALLDGIAAVSSR